MVLNMILVIAVAIMTGKYTIRWW